MLSTKKLVWNPIDTASRQAWDKEFPYDRGLLLECLQAEHNCYVRQGSNALFGQGYYLTNLCVRVYRLATRSSNDTVILKDFVMQRQRLMDCIRTDDKLKNCVEGGNETNSSGGPCKEPSAYDSLSRDEKTIVDAVIRLNSTTPIMEEESPNDTKHLITRGEISRLPIAHPTLSLQAGEIPSLTIGKQATGKNYATEQRPVEVIAGAAILGTAAWLTSRYVIPICMREGTK